MLEVSEVTVTIAEVAEIESIIGTPPKHFLNFGCIAKMRMRRKGQHGNETAPIAFHFCDAVQ